MPHLVEYPHDDDRPISPASSSSAVYRRVSAPPASTLLPVSHERNNNTVSTKRGSSWWTWGEQSSDTIPDVIDTSTSSRDGGYRGSSGGYDDDGDAIFDDNTKNRRQHQQPPPPPYRYVLGAPSPPPPMSPPSRNGSSSSNGSLPLGLGPLGVLRNLDGSDDDDVEDDSSSYRGDRRRTTSRDQHDHQQDRYYRHEPIVGPPLPPAPSPAARSIRSKQRRSHRRSLVERRRSHQKQHPQDPDDEDWTYYPQKHQHRSSSSSSSGAGTGGAISGHSHPSRSSHGGVRRSSHHSTSSGGGGGSHCHRHSIGRRSNASATRPQTDKERLGSSLTHAGKRSWFSTSPQTLLRMLSFAGILSVSLTVLANRNLLLVNDPNIAPLTANSFINWNSRDTVSLHYRNELVSTSSLSSSSTSSSVLLQYPATSSAASAADVAATASNMEPSTALPPALLRGKDKKSASSSRLLADLARSSGHTATTLTSDPRRVRHLTTDADSGPPLAPEPVSSLTLLMPRHNSKAASDHRKHLSGVILPQGKLGERHFESQDRNIFTYHAAAAKGDAPSTSSKSDKIGRRVALLHESWKQHMAASTANGGHGSSSLTYPRRKLRLYPPDFTDPTQLYGVLDSGDERVKMMERRPPLVQGECVPMKEWQTTFHPSCNQLHESIDLSSVGATPQQTGNEFDLFGTKGYWRNAWKVNSFGPHQRTDTVVLKTLKIEHRFEEKVYEHNRIDAIAMERLTSSPHVINVFGFCGNSVVTEYADGKRLGELADKSKKVPLARLRIARDIAQGLADVHGIDGDNTATFVHLDINPANVVSIGGTLKLNDFNIGIIRRRNVTSNEPCGFPAQYPNPQWRSPEEARGQTNLTEKVDVFSMGHIFFRLICGHEPWNKLEPGGKPSKSDVNEKVERGVLPTIPSEIRHSKDPEEVAIRDAMLRCYRHDPVQRPSARDIAIELQKTLDRLESEQKTDVVAPATAAAAPVDAVPAKASE